jgi:NitT/TauT family transport system permease protein
MPEDRERSSEVGEAVTSAAASATTTVADAVAERGRSYGPRLALAAGQIIVGVLLVLMWYAIERLGWISKFYISTPVDVWHALTSMIRSGLLQRNLYATLKETAEGFGIGAGAGILAGLGLAMSPLAERLLEPYINALNSLPRIALAPLFVVFFGIGGESKVAVAVSLVFFVLLINTRAGFKGADRDLLLLAHAYDGTRLQLFQKILLPVAVPSIFAGLRLGLIYALLGVVTGEIIAAKLGLGQLIMLYSGSFNMASVYAVLLVLAVLAVVLSSLMTAVERRLLRWQPPASAYFE